MTHGSLFSGIGGFDLGAEWAGIENLFTCEIDEKCNSVLKKHWPEVRHYNDIRNLDLKEYAGQIDIISGGFPCQDISIAGKMEGIHGERSRLWFDMLRIIRDVRPKYILLENSPALLVRGFEYVLQPLSQDGYDAEWKCLSNLQFGFPHYRERLYVIAYTREIGLKIRNIQKPNSFKSIFRESHKAYGLFSSIKRFYALPDVKDIRRDDGFSGWTYHLGMYGNAVNPCVAKFLFECIKSHYYQFINNYDRQGNNDTYFC